MMYRQRFNELYTLLGKAVEKSEGMGEACLRKCEACENSALIYGWETEIPGDSPLLPKK